jgi:hypothetical protein
MRNSFRTFFLANWPGLLVALLAFAVYLVTLSPFMTWEDSGELATAVATLGVPHPTGYPLFALLGRIFSLLPLGDLRVIVKLNGMVALTCAASAWIFYRLFLAFLTGRNLFPPRAGKASPPPGAPWAEAAAGMGALALSFSATFWSEGVSLEVYALHLLMLSLVGLSFVFSLERPDQERPWILFAYILGLSFSHHMMTVLLAPAFLYLHFSSLGFGKKAWLRIARAVPVFLLGLTPYLYLPLRAATRPLMNWGDPSTWGRLVFHVTGGQYRFKMFSSSEVAWRKLDEFAGLLPREFGYAPLVLAVLGIWAAHRFRRRLLLFTVLMFVACVAYAVNYDFEDPNFYLQAWVVMAAWMTLGAEAVLRGTGRFGGKAAWGGLAACALLAASPLLVNWGDADESRNHAVEDYAQNVLASLPPNAVLYTDQSEYLVSPAYYLQFVEGARPDVVVVDQAQIVAGHAWYFDELERLHPILVRGARREIQAYTDIVLDVRERMPLEGADYEAYIGAYWKTVEALFRDDFGRRPVHATIDVANNVLPNIQKDLSPRFNVVPDGLSFVYFVGRPPALVPKSFAFRPLLRGRPMVERVAEAYAAAYTNEAGYQILASADTLAARRLLREALALRPGYPLALQWLQRVGP